MIRIGVCDDNKGVVSYIEELIFKIRLKENISVEVDGFYSGFALEKEILNGTEYDLLYLDIQMKNGDGITTAKNIRKMDENVLIIYISGYDKYFIELFRFDVFAFIKKPIKEDIFIRLFMEAIKKIASKNYYFTYHYRSQEYKIPFNNILFFESSGRKIIINLKNGEIETFNGKLNEVENRISNGKINFLRIHQSFLVNYHLIKARSKSEVTMINGRKLLISEDRQKRVGQEYSKLLGEEIDS
jgi:DNA-binding LytR/AlgR family response regulator